MEPDLILAAERRVPRPVLSACRVDMRFTDEQLVRWPGGRRYVLALTDDHWLYWIAIDRDMRVARWHRFELGEPTAWTGPLGHDVQVHTRELARHRHAIEIVRFAGPIGDRLYRGELIGVEAEQFAGVLVGAQFGLSPA